MSEYIEPIDDPTQPRHGTTRFGHFHVWPEVPNQVYPCTITAARYQGIYEGGRYLAWPTEAARLPDGWRGGDVTCCEFWSDADRTDAPIGRGATPDIALADLRRRLEELPHG